MTTRKSSLPPAVFAIFLVPVAIPVVFAMLATPWSEGARAQDHGLGPKRAELPADRPASAPMRAGTFPRKAVVNRRSDKFGATDNSLQPQRPSQKVAIQNGQFPNRAPSPPLQSRSANSITKPQAPQALPRIQQASRENAPPVAAPSPNDFVGTEQRSQEVSRKIDADIAQKPPVSKRPSPKRPPVVEVESIEPTTETIAKQEKQESETEPPFDPLDLQPAIATAELETKPSEEMIPAPPEEIVMEEEAEGITNAYFEEPVMEDQTPEEELPFESPQQMLADDLDDSDDIEKDLDDVSLEAAIAPRKVQNINAGVSNSPDINSAFDVEEMETPAKNEPIEVAAQPAELPANVADPLPAKTTPKWFSDLRAINSIDLREATQIPPIAPGENTAKILQPQDQANEFLSQRQAVNFSTAYWKPWQADRDSYPFCHYPLYFEDPNLERCGRGWGLGTTFVSLGRFYANVPFIPYRVTAEPHLRRVPTLPDCPACHKFGFETYLPPWSWKAAAVQTAAYFGAIYIVP